MVYKVLDPVHVQVGIDSTRAGNGAVNPDLQPAGAKHAGTFKNRKVTVDNRHRGTGCCLLASPKRIKLCSRKACRKRADERHISFTLPRQVEAFGSGVIFRHEQGGEIVERRLLRRRGASKRSQCSKEKEKHGRGIGRRFAADLKEQCKVPFFRQMPDIDLVPH